LARGGGFSMKATSSETSTATGWSGNCASGLIKSEPPVNPSNR
jgi:hypothetical protein